MLVNVTPTTRWTTAIARGANLAAECVSGAGTDAQVWRVASQTSPSWHVVRTDGTSLGVNIWCDCLASQHHACCAHAARVALEIGLLCRWQRIEAYREHAWRAGGWRPVGRIMLIDHGGAAQRLSQWDDAHWGPESGTSGRLDTAAALCAALNLDPDEYRDLMGRFLFHMTADEWFIPVDDLKAWLAARAGQLAPAGA